MEATKKLVVGATVTRAGYWWNGGEARTFVVRSIGNTGAMCVLDETTVGLPRPSRGVIVLTAELMVVAS